MKGFLRLSLFLVALAWAAPLHAATPAANPENLLYLDTAYGRVVIQMRPDLAPKTCDQIRALTRKGFYNGLPFHRVIAGFMAQTGDPKGNGTGGSGHTLKAEFTDTKFARGTLGMARAQDPDSADSQFFITFGPATQLDGKYTVWGQVIAGMEFVDRIKKGDSAENGKVLDPDKIVKMQVAADVIDAGGKGH
jgi:cyclophilin family peptidyl-prolyl cis-trans isomerase